MENWESMHRNRQRAYEAFLQKEKEQYWHKSITDAAEHFKLHITQQVEQGIAEYSTALRQIAADVAEAGTQDIMPDERLMISRLIRGLTRQLQQNYCPLPLVDPRFGTFDIPQGAEVVSIAGDSDPPTPASLSHIFFPPSATEVKEEPEIGQREPEEVNRGNVTLEREISQTATPQTPRRQVANVAQASGQEKRLLDSTEAGPSDPARTLVSKRARRPDPKLFSETLDDEPTEQGSIHCREVEGQDYIFSHEAFPGYFFVIRCDREHIRTGITRSHTFSKHPMEYSRAFNHFRQEKAREKCHEEDISGNYDDGQLIVKFGYRVYGDDLEDEDWIARSNEKAEKSVKPSSAPTAGTPRRRGRRTIITARGTRKGKGKTVATSSQSGSSAGRSSAGTTIPGSSSTTRTAPRPPEIGPARRSRAPLTTEIQRLELWNSNVAREAGSEAGTSRGDNVAPVTGLGVCSSPARVGRNTSRPSSHTSTRPFAAVAESMPDGLPTCHADGDEDDGNFEPDEDSRAINDLIDYLN